MAPPHTPPPYLTWPPHHDHAPRIRYPRGTNSQLIAGYAEQAVYTSRVDKLDTGTLGRSATMPAAAAAPAVPAAAAAADASAADAVAAGDAAAANAAAAAAAAAVAAASDECVAHLSTFTLDMLYAA